MQAYSMIIDGKEVGESLPSIEVSNPATGKLIATVPEGGATEASMAVDAAYTAFQEWSRLSAYERSSLLMKWHDLVEVHLKDLAETMTEEQGKPLAEAIGEMKYANGFISWYAEEAKRIYGEIIPASNTGKRIFVHKQPVGVTAIITPWNFPAAMITRKVGPALAAGCTVVIKPAEQTPITAIKLAQLALEAGIPAGVINVVTGEASAIGDAWLKDTRVRKLTFTGSTEVGKTLMRGAADNVKKISLELGGHAPAIVMEDCDIDKAVNGVVAAKFRNAGQTCVCANRIYVHEKIAKDFSERLVERVKTVESWKRDG